MTARERLAWAPIIAVAAVIVAALGTLDAILQARERHQRAALADHVDDDTELS